MGMSTTRSGSIRVLSDRVQSVEGMDVDVKIENLGGTSRRICAGIKIDVSPFLTPLSHTRLKSRLAMRSRLRWSLARVQAPAQAIWQVVTNYDQLQDYVPNIAVSFAQR